MAYALGATLAAGIVFALYSRTATAVDLVLFDRPTVLRRGPYPWKGPTAHTFATVGNRRRPALRLPRAWAVRPLAGLPM